MCAFEHHPRPPFFSEKSECVPVQRKMQKRSSSYSTFSMLAGLGCIILGGLLIAAIVLISIDISQDASQQEQMMATLADHKAAILEGQAYIVDTTISATAGKPVPTPPPTQPPMTCDVAIIGSGPGGLTMAYRLAPIYGSRLCIFDDRNHVGGKVLSQRYTRSSDTRPVWTPTHAEQLRGGDTVLRCMAQEVGTIMVARGTPGLFYDYTALGINATGFQCFGNVTPTGPATCLAGNPYEGILAPNGYTGGSPYGNDLPNPCGNKDWRACSYIDGYTTMLLSASNVNTISVGESYVQYFTRILGVNGARYYSDQYGYDYMNDFDARALVDYLSYDNAYPYGHVHMAHGAPQVGTWNRVAKLISTNGSRIMLNTRIQSVDRDPATGAYTLLTDGGASSITVNAKRVVLAFPPSYVASMSGNVMERLQASPFVSYSKPNHACTWDAFFPTKWWHQYAATCNFGYCAVAKAFNLTSYARDNYMGWNHYDATGSATSISFIQYVPTPERQEGNLLRFFFEEEPCRQFDAIYASSGITGIQTELMSRVKINFATAVGAKIPNPTESYYSSELYAYSGLAPGAPFRATDWLAWGAEPFPGEKLCFATEGINMFDSGWQEGAAKSAHNCLKGNVFKDVIPSTTVQALERCRANITNGANRYLDSSNKNSGNDVCLLLRNEYHIRDLAHYTYCGAPQDYDYPNLASFTSTSYQPNQALWANSATTTIYDTPVRSCQGRYC